MLGRITELIAHSIDNVQQEINQKPLDVPISNSLCYSFKFRQKNRLIFAWLAFNRMYLCYKCALLIATFYICLLFVYMFVIQLQNSVDKAKQHTVINLFLLYMWDKDSAQTQCN